MTNKFLMGFAAFVAVVSLSACGEKASEKADDTSSENAENPAGLVQDASDAVKTTDEVVEEGVEAAEELAIEIGEEVEEGIEEAQDMVEETDEG